jgi:hypothetical protein
MRLHLDQKTQFMAGYLRQHLSMTELCELYSISHRTGYKFVDLPQAWPPRLGGALTQA